MSEEKAQHPKPWTKGQRRRLHTAEAHLESLERLRAAYETGFQKGLDALTERIAKLEAAVLAPAKSFPAVGINPELQTIDFDRPIEEISIGAFDDDGRLIAPEPT